MTEFTSLIVGPGAIGTLTCAHLQNSCKVLVHPHRPEMTLATELAIRDKRHALTWTFCEEDAPIDLIWVCCKAGKVLNTLRPLLIKHPRASVILLHNGMGPQQMLAKQFGDRVIIGSTTCGALRTSNSSYRQTSFGETQLGLQGTSPTPPALVRLLQPQENSGPMRLKIQPEIEPVLWKKLLINACINPITAYHQIQNGQIRGYGYQASIIAICSEVNAILAALGMPSIENGPELVNEVAAISAENWSSMAVDVRNNQPTEIEFINGFLVRQGNELAVPTPELEKWYKRIALTPDS
ncbi:ketopantoate reductase family protein [Reinekea sp. G2M2-21]|uniref:ketopantoate reductase family protein n=1 Tax=Reinekea sp. G2M2-21 TaxID=2788942 RepID=UPI0018A996C9|nr:2-dehydropantoate 2-reductase [Reinekea sp. G2M2-21]